VIFLRDLVWLHIRDQFALEEIKAITAAVRSRRCCPPGVYLRVDDMEPILAAKVRLLILGM
jgi:hypothetical protein